MTSSPAVSSVAYDSESWGYITSYLRPVAAKTTLTQRPLYSHSPPTGDIQFEELRVIPKGSQRATSMTSSGGDHIQSPPYWYSEIAAAYEEAHIPIETSRSPVDRRDYTTTWAKNSPFADGAVGFPEPGLPQPQSAVTSAVKYEKLYPNQHEIYWKTSLMQHGHEPYTPHDTTPEAYSDLPLMKELTRPGNPYEINLADLTRINDIVRAELQMNGEQPAAYHGLPPSAVERDDSRHQHQYRPVIEALRHEGARGIYFPMKIIEPKEEHTRQRPLPNFSPFRVLENAPNYSPGDSQNYHHTEVIHQTERSYGRRTYLRTRAKETILRSRETKKEAGSSSGEDSDDSERSKPSRSHDNKRKVSCNICWKSFSQTANLKAHLRIHTGEKPFQCHVCSQRFSQRSSVKTHMRIHSGERPFACSFCQKSFYDSSTLIKHRRIHTGEKPYTCKICHHQFSQSGNLTRHYKLHTDAQLSETQKS